MRKPQKVKRYKSIYRGPGYVFKRALKISLGVFGLVALVAVGWFAYDPIYSMVMGSFSSQPEQSSSQGTSQASSGGSVPDSSDVGAAQPDTSQPDSEPDLPPEVSTAKTMAAAYMPESILLNQPLRDSFVQMCRLKGIDTIMFDIKNDKGVINHLSRLEKASDLMAVSPSAFSLEQFTAQLKSSGIRSIGRVFAFKDSLASSKNREAAVRYENTEWAWLDNSAEFGGKPWLNPMSTYAREYITELAVEAVEMGVDEIILDTVHFPVGYSTERAGYGVELTEQAKTTALRTFLTAAEQSVAAEGGVLSVYLSAPNLLDASGEKYGYNPSGVVASNCTLGVMPSLFGNVYNSEKFTAESPVRSPYNTVKSALEATLPTVGGKGSVTAMLQCYTASNINALNNKQYTYEDIKEQLRAIADSDVSRYILYSPSGDYSILPDVAQ